MKEYVDGIFTNNHLIKSAKHAKSPLVLRESKDLRIIDPNLDKVVLIDDNPERVFQFHNLRYIRKWKPVKSDDSRHYPAGQHPSFYGQRLLRAVDEIIESNNYAETHNTAFSAAFLPYSHIARQVTQELANMPSIGSWKKAVAYVRSNPGVIDNSY